MRELMDDRFWGEEEGEVEEVEVTVELLDWRRRKGMGGRR
jgi:hypothetical protein